MASLEAAAIHAAMAAQRDFAGLLLDRLRQDGLDEPGVTRDPYGPGEQRAHATIAEAARSLGLAIEHDASANLYMTRPGMTRPGTTRPGATSTGITHPGLDRAAKRVVIGSHLDSVPHGGNFDGAAGVVAGLVGAVRAGQAGADAYLRRHGHGHPRRGEHLVPGLLYRQPRRAGHAAGRGAGRAPHRHRPYPGRPHRRVRRRSRRRCGPARRFLDPADLRAYLELHIEQAPSLVEAGRPVAICTGIPGNFRYPDARIEGSHDHVGLPRRFRRDAAIAGAEFAMAIDRLWEEHEARGMPMAATIGRFHTDPAAHGLTIVPGAFHFSLDVRAYDEAVLAELDRAVDAIIAGIEQRRGVQVPSRRQGAGRGRARSTRRFGRR